MRSTQLFYFHAQLKSYSLANFHMQFKIYPSHYFHVQLEFYGTRSLLRAMQNLPKLLLISVYSLRSTPLIFPCARSTLVTLLCATWHLSRSLISNPLTHVCDTRSTPNTCLGRSLKIYPSCQFPLASQDLSESFVLCATGDYPQSRSRASRDTPQSFTFMWCDLWSASVIHFHVGLEICLRHTFCAPQSQVNPHDSLVHDGIWALGKAQLHTILSLTSFPNVSFETASLFVWLTMALSCPFKEDHQVLPLSTPLSSRRLMAWCPYLCACR